MFKRYDDFIIDGLRVRTLGDTHLGRQFRTGVPLHRRGDREKLIAEDFRNNFRDLEGVDVHVMMGDIFDTPIVSPSIVALAADTYAEAVSVNYNETKFILLRGNHDASRDMEATTSFDILRRIIEPYVEVVSEECFKHQGMLFCPWHPIISAQEMVDAWVSKNSKLFLVEQTVTAAFGHWDIDARCEPFNMIPNIPCDFYVTGHDHKRRMEVRHGKPVHVVGSMQPYKFGEDWLDQLYKTVTLEELSSLPDTTNLCLRVNLKAGEELPPDIDCLQITSNKVAEEDSLTEVVSLDGLDMNQTIVDLLTAEGVNEDLQKTILEKYRA